jgi:hypothetical protein
MGPEGAPLPPGCLFSLTDYQTSPAEMLFFPKPNNLKGGVREPVWQRGDYELLSNADLEQCGEIFVEAREIARETLLEEIEKLKRKGARIRKGSATALATGRPSV